MKLLVLAACLLRSIVASPLSTSTITTAPTVSAQQTDPAAITSSTPGIIRTIPDSCSFSTPLQPSLNTFAVRFTPSPTATPAPKVIYSYYLGPDDSEVRNDTDDRLLQKCEDTCFNYGTTWNFDAPGDDPNQPKCRAVYLAFDAVNPLAEEKGQVPGSVECLLFDGDLQTGDFVLAQSRVGVSKGARAVNLGCPQY